MTDHLPKRKLTPIRIAAAIATLIAVIVALLWLAPGLIPAETYKRQIHDRLQAMTGREVTIGGDVSLRFLPTVRVVAEDVFIGQPATFQSQTDQPFAAVEKLNVSVQLWPLLSKQVVVDRFELEKPAIHLMQNAQGIGNWTFEPEVTGEAQPTGQPQTSTSTAPSIAISDLSIRNGALTFQPAGGEATRVTALDANLNLPGLDRAAKFDIKGTLNSSQTLKAEGEVSTPNTWLAGEATELTANVAASPYGKASFKGTVTPNQPMRLQGQITADTADASLTGTVTAAFPEGSPITVKADLKAGKILDITPWLAPQEDEASDGDALEENSEAAIPPAQPASSEWSRETVLPDLSALRQVNADIAIATQGIKAEDLEIGAFPLKVTTQNGALTATFTEMPIYGGTVTAKATLDQNANITKQVTVNQMQAEPFLTHAAGFNRLTGATDLTFAMRTQGRSMHDWVHNLNGNGKLVVKDGQIKGVDIAGLVRKATMLASTVFQMDSTTLAEDKPLVTNFLQLGGSFTITNGIVSNNDLALQGPLLAVSGKGTVNLPKQTVDYLIQPRLQGAKAEETSASEEEAKTADTPTEEEAEKVDWLMENAPSDLSIPIRISGPFSKLTFRPDAKGVAESFAKDPKGTIKRVEDQVRGVRDNIKNLEVKDKDALKEGLKGLLGGGLPGQQQQQPSEAAPQPGSAE